MKPLSVVIPTKDRAFALAETLAGLEAQKAAAGFEVLVVDNGSGDDTLARVRGLIADAALHIQLIEHPEGGPAAARNAGVAASNGAAILFLGDDTEPANAGLVQAHIDLHSARPEESYGVLGRITWSTRNPITPFMHWLENGGPQFSYSAISAGPVDAANYFYSSHASVKRSMLDRVGGFDPRFPSAAVEDTELGVRLAAAGIELDYHPELLVLHDHPTTLSQSLARQVRVGRSAALYNELRPDRPHADIAPPVGAAWTALGTLRPLIDVTARLPLPQAAREPLWLAMHHARYAQGYRLGPPEIQ